MAVPHIDPLVVRFAGVVSAVLVAAMMLIALVSCVLRHRRPELVRELWLRWVSWVAIALALLGALSAGRSAWVALIALVSAAAFREFGRAVGLWRDRSFMALGYVSIAAIYATAWWPFDAATPGRGWYGLFTAMPAYVTLATLTIPIISGRFEHMLQQACLALLAVIYLGWALGHLAFLANLPGGTGIVVWLCFLVAVNDVAAFVAGRLAGRHKLRPALSPGKTWEGALGGLVVVLAVGWGLRWLVPAYPAAHVVTLALLVGVCGVLGDLALAVMKRDLGMKDWGTAIPGHGGVLDRLNSLVFTAPICFHYTQYFFT
jgi:phosphatidate cytidylyltransferase